MEHKTKNRYTCPVTISDKIRVAYNESPAHVGSLKNAVDFICEEGTEVKAGADGVVIDVKSDSDIGGQGKELEPFGNFIELQHDNEEYSEYEHLRKNGVLVKVGDMVKRGQVIGYSGATGWLAHLGPHLHFMVGAYASDANGYRTLKIVWDDL